ncbi:MAG TPA: site-specific integrase, partial [Candidatus Latescibacteria bacterium]|nr:site-specific integrase [Candidatus Latescibacterota bacterium]
KNPAARVKKLKEAPPRERILTEDEARRLIDAADPRFKPVLVVALGTGMRRGEILSLKWTDLDFTMGVIAIAISKSGKPRKIPMSGPVAAALGAVPRHGEYVFWNPETKTRIKDVKTTFHAACARAKKNPEDEKDPGITAVRFHDLRHTAATWMLQTGTDIMTVSKILGHASIVMTQRYCHTSGESQRLAVDRIGGILDSTRPRVDTPPKAIGPTPSVTASKRDN